MWTRLQHWILRVADRLGRRFPRRRRRQGVAVAVWHGDELLFVRHSYRSGHDLPGGSPRRGESFRHAARRELLEETGIDADPDALIPGFTTAWIYLVEYYPCRRPEPRPDGREVVEGRFAAPDTVPDRPEYVDDYLRSRIVRAGE